MGESKSETEKSPDEVLRRALNTLPKPKQESVKQKDKPKKEKAAKWGGLVALLFSISHEGACLLLK